MVEKYKDTIKRIRPIAQSFIIQNNLEYPIQNSMQVLSEMGYFIIKAKAPDNLSGFYMKKDRFPFIFVNSKHSLGRQNFSLWHEVYHNYMKHQNGISDFASNTLEEREAEIFAGFVLLPDEEIKKWASTYDLKDPNTIACMSEYYQMSFNAVLVRLMQIGEVTYDIYNVLKQLSDIENRKELLTIYKNNNLSKSVLNSTNDTSISANIMEILQRNYQNNLIDVEKINEIIDKIEVLDNDFS